MLDAVQHGLGAVREDDVVDLEVALDARQLVRRRARSRISGSSSRIVAIFTIAAAPDCSCP